MKKYTWIKTRKTAQTEENINGAPDWKFETGKHGKVIGKMRTSAKYYEFDSVLDAINYAENKTHEKY